MSSMRGTTSFKNRQPGLLITLKNHLRRNPYLIAAIIAIYGVTAFFSCGFTLLPAFAAVLCGIGNITIMTLALAAAATAVGGISSLLVKNGGPLGKILGIGTFLIGAGLLGALTSPVFLKSWYAALAGAPALGISLGVLVVAAGMLAVITFGLGSAIKWATKDNDRYYPIPANTLKKEKLVEMEKTLDQAPKPNQSQQLVVLMDKDKKTQTEGTKVVVFENSKTEGLFTTKPNLSPNTDSNVEADIITLKMQ